MVRIIRYDIINCEAVLDVGVVDQILIWQVLVQKGNTFA